MKSCHKLFGAVLAMAAVFSLAVTASARDAKLIYEKDCAKCHGKDGRGDTKMGLKLRCKDYTDPKVQAKITDEKAFKVIREGAKEKGKVVMEPSTYSDEEIKGLIAVIRSFKK